MNTSATASVGDLLFPSDLNLQQTDVCRRLARNARGHLQYALWLKRCDSASTALAVIGSILLLVLSAMLTVAPVPLPEIGFALVAASLVVTLVSILQIIWRPGERSQRHKTWGGEFAALENETKLSLCGHGEADLRKIMADMTAISVGADLVPRHIWRSARGNFHHRRRTLPPAQP